ncbi:LOW QUALITY PROTEIN: Pol protein [Phytophthora palmivora]|uniref:Pol protein n=1 Tax=Phytophthora palmivora TaxID=4796 RepID=A0A2P4YG63_9STRA|nr:LOW QUALITY PROTEIN: Pol protein [Phytophthora palmivora]
MLSTAQPPCAFFIRFRPQRPARRGSGPILLSTQPPHTTPTYCARKPNGKFRLVHAYNKLHNAAVPVQTPIPR